MAEGSGRIVTIRRTPGGSGCPVIVCCSGRGCQTAYCKKRRQRRTIVFAHNNSHVFPGRRQRLAAMNVS
jgi:hypothetical protein